MKIFLLFFLFLLPAGGLLPAQTKAVTQTGDEVILYDDGTWKYVNAGDVTGREIALNPAVFTKNEEATFLLKSNTIPVGVWLNPKKWSFKKNTDSSSPEEYELEMRDGDAWAILITEESELSPEVLHKIVVENAREAAPDLQVQQEEFRNVNGHKVLMIRMKGTINGTRIAYQGYYFTGPEGTVQFLSYTAQNLAEKYRQDMEELLNGLTKL